ncbi:hypothetical protein AN191_07655 [Loktanella sp. 5RATIMAR09]|uniref:polyketide synthase n=1 Tax=Loktanella sp. 5RATIMAR09 TaxID=1225655 RepID=UPI00070813F1|nr:polyketide synthase [Loktanella sp. 5RATIMAR09]KQI72026.1 hypothetical protein AN191_07655 [Loktanella sp. 5RATIMAR09]
MRNLASLFSRFFLTFAVLVAMAGAGFAHRFATPDVDDSLLAYMAAGGALGDICSDAGQWDAGGGHCDACRLVYGAVVPPAAILAPSELEANLLQVGRYATAVPFASAANPACPVRAPPMV